jgi:hypothetical protein
MGRGRRAGSLTGRTLQKAGETGKITHTVAYLDHGAYKHTDHVAEKGLSFDLEAQETAGSTTSRQRRAGGQAAGDLLPTAPQDQTFEEDMLGLGGREGSEIVVALDSLGGGTQGRQVLWAPHMPAVSRPER